MISLRKRRWLLLLQLCLLATFLISLRCLLSAEPEADEAMIRKTSNLQTNLRSLQREIDYLKFTYHAADKDNCEVIHVAVVCAGYATTRDFVTLLKSVLAHRRNPLHFHIITDTASERVLIRLFDTWLIAAFSYTLYPAAELYPLVDWVPNKHYSGVFGLLKLILPRVLPETLDRVIVLDTDVVLTSDVAELAHFFRDMKPEQVLALAENQSGWYNGGISYVTPWPALGRGFNTGVILLKLSVLRSLHWDVLWRKVAKKQLETMKETTLADQDIFNAVIAKTPRLVYRLPCEFNLQLGDNMVPELCLDKVTTLKILHWNTQDKSEIVTDPEAGPFHLLYLSFIQTDASLFRSFFTPCNITASLAQIQYKERLYDLTSSSRSCMESKRAAKAMYRVHLFYYAGTTAPPKDDITIITQLSMDRLAMLDALCQHWPGPVSAALYVNDGSQRTLLHLLSRLSCWRDGRQNVALHAVFEEGNLYPINYLRNVALDSSQTDFVFLLDVDFITSPVNQEVLTSIKGQLRTGKKIAVVVPAFETQLYRDVIPDSKEALVQRVKAGTIHTFRSDVWSRGHAATNYNRWFNSQQPYTVQWASDYEPYIITSRQVARYSEDFVGFAWNKVSHIMELDALAYTFSVTPNLFVVHQNHAPSAAIIRWREDKVLKDCIEQTKLEFTAYLSNKYGIAALKYIANTPAAVP